MKENLPPLRGHYERPSIVRQRDLREQAQMNLATIEGGYSAWAGGTGIVNHRSGTAGFDALTALQAPFEASAPLSTGGRLTIVSNPVFLDSGAVTKSPLLPGGIAERLGTAPANAVLNQQNAVGVGGEVQFATDNLAAAVGYSPWGFLVSNVIGRVNWKPGNGPLTFTATRDSVKDSQLSYSGLRDPGSVGPGFAGNAWGGVVSTGGEVQYGKSDPSSGFYVSVGGQHLNGVHVQSNNRIDGDAGAYFRVKEVPDEGNLTVGVNFFGMHYSTNENFFTYGHGGYFSPQAYYLANVPFSFEGRYGPNIHYSAVAAFGLEAFQQDSAPYFPLDTALEVANNNASYSVAVRRQRQLRLQRRSRLPPQRPLVRRRLPLPQQHPRLQQPDRRLLHPLHQPPPGRIRQRRPHRPLPLGRPPPLPRPLEHGRDRMTSGPFAKRLPGQRDERQKPLRP